MVYFSGTIVLWGDSSNIVTIIEVTNIAYVSVEHWPVYQCLIIRLRTVLSSNFLSHLEIDTTAELRAPKSTWHAFLMLAE